MLTQDEHAKFPVGVAFLELQARAFSSASEFTATFSTESGKKLPATVDGLGTVLSCMYRVACCAWGCQGGDHQLEWLAGRVVNQANAAFRLIQSASYDEAFMLVRGIGEIANLLWLFQSSPQELSRWSAATRRERLDAFGPAAVRRKLTELQPGVGPPIDATRYQRLCEVGTHPVPGQAPSHYSGTGRPMLSGLVQPVAIYTSMTELGYATAMCGTPVATLALKEQQARQQLFDASLQLLRSLGSFTILNYEELLEQSVRDRDAGSSPFH